MAYAVWIRKGEGVGLTTYDVDGLPPLRGNVAVKITEEQRLVAKHLIGVTVFDQIEGTEEDFRNIEFEGETYKYNGTKFEKPIKTEIYERMKKEGVI